MASAGASTGNEPLITTTSASRARTCTRSTSGSQRSMRAGSDSTVAAPSSTTVTVRRVGDACRDGVEPYADRGQVVGEVVTGGATERQHEIDVRTHPVQHPCHVDALAARSVSDALHPVGRAGDEFGQPVGDVDRPGSGTRRGSRGSRVQDDGPGEAARLIRVEAGGFGAAYGEQLCTNEVGDRIERCRPPWSRRWPSRRRAGRRQGSRRPTRPGRARRSRSGPCRYSSCGYASVHSWAASRIFNAASSATP